MIETISVANPHESLSAEKEWPLLLLSWPGPLRSMTMIKMKNWPKLKSIPPPKEAQRCVWSEAFACQCLPPRGES